MTNIKSYLTNSKTKTIKGKLHSYFETGTEGVYWAIQDEKYIGEPFWDMKGLNILENGDHLTIFEKGSKNVLWEGELKLSRMHKVIKTDPHLVKTLENGYSQLNIDGVWVHTIPNIPLDLLRKVFFADDYGDYDGILRRKK